jgi:hypothetical protein
MTSTGLRRKCPNEKSVCARKFSLTHLQSYTKKVSATDDAGHNNGTIIGAFH